MSREDLKRQWLSAADNKTFLTYKHDPVSIGDKLAGYRTITVESPSGIVEFIQSDQYAIKEYEQTGGSHSSPYYYELVPFDPKIVPGSGIQARSTAPTDTADRFVVVSGSEAGWHISAEQSEKIKERIKHAELKFVGDL